MRGEEQRAAGVDGPAEGDLARRAGGRLIEQARILKPRIEIAGAFDDARIDIGDAAVGGRQPANIFLCCFKSFQRRARHF